MKTPNALVWRKSSRSNGSGGQACVEVGAWRTSSRTGSADGQNCVEVGTCPTHVAVRDTKNRSGGILSIDAAEWSGWLSSIKDGSFDG